MSLFRRPQQQRERTPEEREYARRLREARRRGEPDPPRPEEPDAPSAEPAAAPPGPGADREEAEAADPGAGEAPAAPDEARGHDEPEAASGVPAADAESGAARVEPEEPGTAAEPEPAVERDGPEVGRIASAAQHEEPHERPLGPAGEPDVDRFEAEAARAARALAPVEDEVDDRPSGRHTRGRNAADDIPGDEEPEHTDDWFAGVPAGDRTGTEDWTAEQHTVAHVPDAATVGIAERDGRDPDDEPELDGDDEPDDPRSQPPGSADVPRTPPRLPAPAAARQPPRPPRRRYVEPRRSGRGGPVTTGHRRRRYGLRILALVALVLVGGAIWFSISLFQPGKGDGHGRVAVTVPAGATAREIGDLLAERGVVSSGFFFNLRAALAGKRDDMKAGRFVMARDMSYMAAIDRLTQNPAAPPTVKVTLPEGRSRKEMAPLVEKAGLKGSYLKATRHVKDFSPRRYGAPKGTTSLEGFLFPATYELRRSDATARRLVADQLAAFRRNFASLDLGYAKRRNLTPYDVLIIASMIEREAAVPKDRRLISAVIYNRLHDGMALGIDATLRYALDQWTQPLHESELADPTPYNTRLHQGLPPTPIGNPGLASLQAAAKPAHVSYLYYVVKPCGNGAHAFSSTDAQFQRDVRRYNAARDKKGGKSPAQC